MPDPNIDEVDEIEHIFGKCQGPHKCFWDEISGLADYEKESRQIARIRALLTKAQQGEIESLVMLRHDFMGRLHARDEVTEKWIANRLSQLASQQLKESEK